MEQIGVRSKRIMWTFIALYALVLILRPIQGFPTINASLFIPMAVAIGWAQSVKERIIDRTNRKLLRYRVAIILATLYTLIFPSNLV